MKNKMMKMLMVVVGLSFGSATTLSADGYSVPVRAVFVSQMMPRYVGTVSIHGAELGLSDKSFEAANEIRDIIMPMLKPIMKKVKKLENKVFELSLKKGTHEQIVKLLKEMATLKLDASLIQLKCIELYKEKASKEDFEKINKFLKTKKEEIMQHVNII